MYRVGIDIGGMSIKIGLVDENGKIVRQNRVKTAPTAKECIDNMVNQINDLMNEQGIGIESLKGIGVGCPGAVTRKTGMVAFLPNLGWRNVSLSKLLKDSFNLPVVISNDANVAALAETVYGVAKDFNDVIMFTIGTGLGGGIVIDKKLYEGYESRGAELGHATLILGGEPCSCGRSGCIECYTSATALIKQTKTAMEQDKSSKMWDFVGGDIENVDGRTAFECAKQGDTTAKKVQDNYIMYLGESVLNMLNIFRPEAFIIGGGVSAQGKYLTDLLDEYCKKFDYGYKDAPAPKILTATLGNDAGIIGAAALID